MFAVMSDRKRFDGLAERGIPALPKSSKESDARVYRDVARWPREGYPATEKVLEGMRRPKTRAATARSTSAPNAWVTRSR